MKEFFILYNIIKLKEKAMNTFLELLQKFNIFEKEPQKIGLTQIKEPVEKKKKDQPSIKNKDVKLSDLMRRAS